MKRPHASGDAVASALHPCKGPRESSNAAASQPGAIDEPAAPPLETNLPLDKHNLLKRQTEMRWVYEDGAMVYRNVSYIEVLYTIFDDILRSARSFQPDPKDDLDVKIKMGLAVKIKMDKCCISMCCSRTALPIKKDDFNPWDVLLLKESAFKNHITAQVSSIFSKVVMKTSNGDGKESMKVLYDKSGKNKNYKIKQCNWQCTRVKFCLNELDDDISALIRKMVVDLAAFTQFEKVQLDGRFLKLNKGLPYYVDMYLEPSEKKTSKRVYQRLNEYMEVCVCLSRNGQQQISFINGVLARGVHVNLITNRIEMCLQRALEKKKLCTKNMKNYLCIFIYAKTPSPWATRTEMRDNTTDLSRIIDFNGGKPMFSAFLKNVKESVIFKELLRCALKDTLALATNKVDESIEAIEKFEDAIGAGGVDSRKCTLIITEGDSAMSLVLGIVRRDCFGVLALKGKLLNVRDASVEKIKDNEEINNMRKIIGLDYDKDYNDKDLSDLRYGRIMLMTDPDPDGYHIKGLIINFFHYFWPSILKVESFLSEFVTPIIKATWKNETECFYTMGQYKAWEESQKGTDLSEWHVKYYKGLGTMTLEEGRHYFRQIDEHKNNFEWVDEEDDKAIEIAFSKEEVKGRKKWIIFKVYEPETLRPQKGKTRILHFMKNNLVLYMLLDVQRSIPSMLDGFKRAQRKIIYTAMNNNLNKNIKVAQLGGYVAQCSAYHHGEENLSNTITRMAQEFVGSNNINLLHPDGQFGTRLEGGKDAAHARYINTKLSSITRKIFNENDDILLNYLHEDGQSIEPTWYLPILPMILVNGGAGIGTGWSTMIPCYNPRDIVCNLKHLIQSERPEEMELTEMKPWFRNFRGEVNIANQTTKKSGVTFTTIGLIDVVDKTTLKITELPMNTSMDTYEKKLKSIMDQNDNPIKSYEKKKGGNDVEIMIHLHENCENLTHASKAHLVEKFKLTSSINTSNMHLLDSNGILQKYDTPQQILKEFYVLRLAFYKKRKQKLLEKAEDNLKMAQNQVKFIKAVQTGKINLFDIDKEVLCMELNQFDQIENQDGAKGLIRGYDYLLSMPIVNFTPHMVQGLEAECEHQQKNISELKNTSAENLWLKDLLAFEEELNILHPEDCLQHTALFTDLQSLSGTNWITHGVIQRIFAIFSKTFSNEKILFLTQAVLDGDAITRLPLLRYSLIFIYLKAAHVSYGSHYGEGEHFSLLVYTRKGRFKFGHYDTLGSVNRALAESVAESIKKVIPAFDKEDVIDLTMPGQKLSMEEQKETDSKKKRQKLSMEEQKEADSKKKRQIDYNCGVYVLAISEAICTWFVKNEKCAQKLKLGYTDFVKDRIKDLGEVTNMRKTYYQMIVKDAGVSDPGFMGMDFIKNTSPKKLLLKDLHTSPKKLLLKDLHTSPKKLLLKDLHTSEELDILRPQVSGGRLSDADKAILRGTKWITNGLTEEQRKGLLIDLKSLTPKEWITDGVIDRIYKVFFETFNGNIEFLTQGESTMLDEVAIKRLSLIHFPLIFIPVNSSQMRPYRSDDGEHFSLLVLDGTKKGKYMFRHYDTAQPVNKKAAKSIAETINKVKPDFAQEEVIEPCIPRQEDGYNCGVYVLAITEAICTWFKENEKSAHELECDDFVRDKIKDSVGVNNMRKKYYHMILDHAHVSDPGLM